MSARRPSRFGPVLLAVALLSSAVVSSLPDPRWTSSERRTLLVVLGVCNTILAVAFFVDGGRSGR